MNNKKNKRNLKKQKSYSNDLFGIKNITKTFLVGEGENRKTVQTKLWVIYEKATGNNLAAGNFSQMMSILTTMSTLTPAQVVETKEVEVVG